METFNTDILILGGGTGGCAAALAACRAGQRVIMTEESDWIGGQLTSQVVPPDEHGWIEKFGCTKSYRAFREHVRAYYRSHYPLEPRVAAYPFLNPGNGWVSPLCHEPKIGLAVLRAMLAPHVTARRLTIWYQHVITSVALDGTDRLKSVVVRNVGTGVEARVVAPYFVDATENGDVLPLAHVEHVTGAESRKQTGEPDAKTDTQPDNVQAFSFCFVMDYEAGRPPPESEPNNYSYWRRFVPPLTPPWPGPWLGWNGLNPRTMQVLLIVLICGRTNRTLRWTLGFPQNLGSKTLSAGRVLVGPLPR